MSVHDHGTVRFRLRGVPVEVQPAFWIATVVLGSDRLAAPHHLLIWVAVVFGSVLLHEMGHALMFRRLGHRPSIELGMMGGQAQGAGSGLNPTGEILVSLAGPAAGLAIGLPLLLMAVIAPGLLQIPVLGVLLGDLIWVNVGWGLVNLLPVLPLDGGQVLLATLRERGTSRATLRANQVSAGVAALAAIAAFLLDERLVALGAGALAVHNVLAARAYR
jgi:stage IV sporulation protein FB